MGCKERYKKEIEYLRRELHKSGLGNGFTHEKTIEISQKLDVLMNRYTRKRHKKIINCNKID